MDVGLYIHIPFCAKKCKYCDFYSNVADKTTMASFVEAVLIELNSAVVAQDVRVKTIFIGGGTPSLLPEDLLTGLLMGLKQIVNQHEPEEFTIEANPATLSDSKACILREHGVNRISIGIQSFQSQELQVLGRIHGLDDITESVEIIRRAGFEHLNFDLIFGIPDQTMSSWRDSLQRAVDLGPDHMACYGLTYEPGTLLHAQRDAGTIIPVEQELEAEMYLAAIDRLAEAGFEHYEISNFAHTGGFCRHNLGYWNNQPSIGIGPSAVSFMAGRRWKNVPDTAEYVHRVLSGKSLAEESETLTSRRRAGELAMLQLRLIKGLKGSFFREKTGYDPHRLFAPIVDRCVRKGLLRVEGEYIALTRKGLLLADEVIADFLFPEHESEDLAKNFE